MCEARWRTRDLLLEYALQLKPRTAGLKMVYPWESTSLDHLKEQLYSIAINSGYNGTEEDFKKNFGSFLSHTQILVADYNNFPQVGQEKIFYFDKIEKILYYWDNGYIPVNTLLIANTILEGGGA